MGIYIDTASLRKLEDFHLYPFLAGVTTNPTIIAKSLNTRALSKEAFLSHITKIRDLTSGDLFVQTNYSDRNSIVNEALEIMETVGDRGVIKIPCNLVGMQAMKDLTHKGIRVASTAVFTGVQAYLSMECGAKFVIPYVSRISRAVNDWREVVEDMLDITESQGFEAEILAASVKTPFDVLELLRMGVPSITLTEDILSTLFFHHQTESAVQDFSTSLQILEMEERKE